MTATKTNDILNELRARDGDRCQHPDCGEVLDFALRGSGHKNEPTIDHWFSRYYGRSNGWTEEQINALSNLRIMHRHCNAQKGSMVPNPDGTLPTKQSRMTRRINRGNRPMVCNLCESGRLLLDGEQCELCGSTPQPSTFPNWAQVRSDECPHSGPWSCFRCIVGIVDRTEPASADVFGVLE